MDSLINVLHALATRLVMPCNPLQHTALEETQPISVYVLHWLNFAGLVVIPADLLI